MKYCLPLSILKKPKIETSKILVVAEMTLRSDDRISSTIQSAKKKKRENNSEKSYITLGLGAGATFDWTLFDN